MDTDQNSLDIFCIVNEESQNGKFKEPYLENCKRYSNNSVDISKGYLKLPLLNKTIG